MKYNRYLPALGLILFLPAGVFAADGVPHWQVLPEKSSIEWTATYGSKPIKGTFPDFTADIAYDQQHLDASKMTIKFAMAKFKSDDKDAQENLPASEWLAINDFPLAVFESTNFTCGENAEKKELAQCNAQGTLTIRGKPVKITLPYSISFYSDNDTSPSVHYARVSAQVPLKRLDFGIGQGDWVKTDVMADEVQVVIHIEAKQVP